MKILYVGSSGGLENTGRFYLFPPRIINGFIRNGHQVQVFHDKDVARLSNPLKSSRWGIKKTNELLLKHCHDYMPDLVILAHCQFINGETVTRMREVCPGVKVIHLNVDPLNDIGNAVRIQHRVGSVDGIFVTTAGEALKTLVAPETYAVFIPNLVDMSIDTGKAFENKTHSADLFFAAGAMRKNDHRQILVTNLLEKTPGLVVDIYGTGINNRKIFGVNYMNKLASSKMGLVINKTEDYYLYASDRMSQYMANGMMVFAHAKPRYTDLFSNGEFVTYETEKDLIDKVNYYHTHDNERIEIAAKGYHKIHEIFHNQLVAKYVVDMAFDQMNGTTYPWPVKKYTVADE